MAWELFWPWYETLPRNAEAYASTAAGGILFISLAVFPAVPLTLAFPFQVLSFAFALAGGRNDASPGMGRRWAAVSALALCVEAPGAALMAALVVTGAVEFPSASTIKAEAARLVARHRLFAPGPGTPSPAEEPPTSPSLPPDDAARPPPDDVTETPGETACARDEECHASTACSTCGRCFSRAPVIQVDCKMACNPRVTCRCVQGACVAGPLRTRPLDAGRIALEQVNATACRSDSDCAMTTLQCQSGCSGVPVNRASPLFEAFEEQRLADDPCCMPNAQCPTTACVQQRVWPRCEQGKCELTDAPRP